MKKCLVSKQRKGFTLVELLVAATIIGILAVFATTSYRNSTAETRWTQAKANLDQLATAIQRFKMDYPNVRLTATPMSNTYSCGSISYSSTGQMAPGCLIYNNYLEASDWDSAYYQYISCDLISGSPCNQQISSGAGSATFDPLACVGARDGAKLPDKYLKLWYCVFENGEGGEFSTI